MTQALWAVVLMSLVQATPADDSREGIRAVAYDAPHERRAIQTNSHAGAGNNAPTTAHGPRLPREAAACGDVSAAANARCGRGMRTARAQGTYRD